MGKFNFFYKHNNFVYFDYTTCFQVIEKIDFMLRGKIYMTYFFKSQTS